MCKGLDYSDICYFCKKPRDLSVQAALTKQTGWLVNNKHLFLLVLEARGPRSSKAPADSLSGEGTVPGS